MELGTALRAARWEEKGRKHCRHHRRDSPAALGRAPMEQGLSCSLWRRLGRRREPHCSPQDLHWGMWIFPEETAVPLAAGVSWRTVALGRDPTLEQGKIVWKTEQQGGVFSD